MQRQLSNPLATIQGSSKLSLFLALGLAIATGVVIFAALQQAETKTAPPTAAAAPLSIVTASQDITSGTRITAGMLEVTQVPLEAVLDGTVLSLDLAVGQIARIPILEGDPILTRKPANEASAGSGLTYVIPDGRRAVAIKVDKVIAAGGLIQPGDRVDIYAVLEVDRLDPLTGQRIGGVERPLIVPQFIEVLAVEQELLNVVATEGNQERTPEAGGTLLAQADPQPTSDVVTLAVTPAEAQLLLFAEEEGAIRLAVRGPEDNAIVASPEFIFSDIASDDLALNADTSLAFIVPDGFRAMSVSVDKVIGVGGLIRPGDPVDVLAVLEISIAIEGAGLEEGVALAVTLAQGLEVLAVEQALANPADAEGQPSVQPSASVITLAVEPQMAQAIFLAEQEGTLRLAVRPPGDLEFIPLATTAFYTFFGDIGPVQLLTSQDIDLLAQ